MGFTEDFKKIVKEAASTKFKGDTDLAKKANVAQSAVSMLNNNKRSGLQLETVGKLLDAIGARIILPESPEMPVIRRTGSMSPLETVKGESLPEVPVLGSAGAGDAIDFFAMPPDRFIQVLPAYAVPGVVALLIEGDSMEPTIKKGSYVGVVPLRGGIIEGEIYLVNLPYFGRVVKRIRMGANGLLEMYSDNKNYLPQHLPNEGYDDIIIGKVVWIWQLC